MSIQINSHFSTATLARIVNKVKEDKINQVQTTLEALEAVAVNHSTVGRILGKIYDFIAVWQSEKDSYAAHYKAQDKAKKEETRRIFEGYQKSGNSPRQEGNIDAMRFPESTKKVRLMLLIHEGDLYCYVETKKTLSDCGLYEGLYEQGGKWYERCLLESNFQCRLSDVVEQLRLGRDHESNLSIQ